MVKLKHSFSSLDEFDQCPKKYYHKRIAKDVVDKPSDASIYGERVHKSLELRLTDSIELPKDLAKHESKCAAIEAMQGTVKAEYEMAITKDFIPTGWWSDDAFFRAKADVCVIKSDSAAALDWKTGKRSPKFLQLELTSLMLMTLHPSIQKVSVAFVWLKDEQIDKEVYTRKEHYNMIAADLEYRTRRIEEALSEDVWQAKPGWHCKFCPAREICSYANR